MSDFILFLLGILGGFLYVLGVGWLIGRFCSTVRQADRVFMGTMLGALVCCLAVIIWLIRR